MCGAICGIGVLIVEKIPLNALVAVEAHGWETTYPLLAPMVLNENCMADHDVAEARNGHRNKPAFYCQ